MIEGQSAIPGEVLEYIDYYPVQAMGRIYRIAQTDVLPMPRPRVSKASSSEFVGALVRENGRWRSTAQRLLFESQAVEIAPALGACGKSLTGPAHHSQGLSDAWQGLQKSRNRALLAVNQADSRRQDG